MNIIEQTSSLLTIPQVPPWMVGLGLVAAFVIFMVGIGLNCYTVWLAARRGHKWWFVLLLLVKTLGVLELIYLALHRKHAEAPQLPNWQ